MNDGLRIGKVSAVDTSTGMVKVYYPDRGSVTGWLPYVNYGKEYNLPAIDTGVLVGHLTTGGCDAVVIGTYWNKANTPTETGNVYYKQISKMPGDAYIKYNEETGELTIKAKTITLEQGGDG